MTHLGTFVPLQPHNMGWGWGINQNPQLGLTGVNPAWGWTQGTNPSQVIHAGQGCLTSNQGHSGQGWLGGHHLQPWGTTHSHGGWTQAHGGWTQGGWNPNTGWAHQGIACHPLQNAGLPHHVWNVSPSWNTSSLMGNQGWGNTHQNHPYWGTQGFGGSVSESSSALSPQGTQLGFVPFQGNIQGGSFTTGSSHIPSWGGGQHLFGGVGQSFATELSETNNEYVISFDVPGINVEDLDLSLAGSTILINGIRKGSHDSSLAYSEIARGTISRAIGVPFELTPNKTINTSLENGVLKIRIAKDSQNEKKLTGRKVKIG